jgi:ketosteroid isomerase-like protein
VLKKKEVNVMIGTLIARSKIRSGFNSLNQHRMNEFVKDWADDATFIYPGNVSVSGEFKGKKAIEEWFQKFMEQCPHISFTIKHICFQNIFDMTGTNHVAVEWDVELTNKDGKELKNSGVTTLELKMGKAILVRDYIVDLEAVKKEWGEG